MKEQGELLVFLLSFLLPAALISLALGGLAAATLGDGYWVLAVILNPAILLGEFLWWSDRCY